MVVTESYHLHAMFCLRGAQQPTFPTGHLAVAQVPHESI